ncbi:MAG: hypothetical protein E7309_15990 [Butyrivibrio sp.]|nr:hypothetical protein [Butyrivibrio sp.]
MKKRDYILGILLCLAFIAGAFGILLLIFGRAAFGINGESSIIENYGVVWATDRWQHYGN